MQGLAKNHVIENKILPWFDSQHKKILLILLGIAVLIAASQLSIPLQPVPLTFQSATVVMLAMTFGKRTSIAMISVFLLLGAMGLPVYADFKGGLVYLFGPTGGYLLGFVPAAAVTGYLAEKGFAKNIFLSFVTALIGTSIIFSCGMLVLSQFVGWHQAWLLGTQPFLVSELIKLIAVAGITQGFWKHRK